LPLLFSHFVVNGQLPIERFVELTSANPARLNGIYPRKGATMPGSDADIAIWSREGSHELTTADLHMATDYTPFEGTRLSGTLETVMVKGHLAFSNGSIHDDATSRGEHAPAFPLRW
jgi:dihydropyrimidinase